MGAEVPRRWPSWKSLLPGSPEMTDPGSCQAECGHVNCGTGKVRLAWYPSIFGRWSCCCVTPSTPSDGRPPDWGRFSVNRSRPALDIAMSGSSRSHAPSVPCPCCPTSILRAPCCSLSAPGSPPHLLSPVPVICARKLFTDLWYTVLVGNIVGQIVNQCNYLALYWVYLP